MSDLLLQKANKIIVFDGFNRADNALTLGNADTGQAWNILDGFWGIINGNAYMNNVTQSKGFVDSGAANFEMTVELIVNNVNTRVIVFRLTDTNNFWFLGIDASNNYTITKQVSGSNTLMGTGNQATDGDKIKINCLNQIINVYINNVLSFTISDSFNTTATKHGLASSGLTTLRWDNFKVVSL